MKRRLKWIVIALAAVFVVIQLVPVDRTNPAGGKPFDAPPNVQAIAKRACFDCHSNETVWPWYSYVAPVSWLVAHDVEEGRKHLNLSYFADMSPEKRSAKADEMAEEAERDFMPLPNYLKMHSEAKLSAEDKKALRTWADGL